MKLRVKIKEVKPLNQKDLSKVQGGGLNRSNNLNGYCAYSRRNGHTHGTDENGDMDVCGPQTGCIDAGR